MTLLNLSGFKVWTVFKGRESIVYINMRLVLQHAPYDCWCGTVRNIEKEHLDSKAGGKWCSLCREGPGAETKTQSCTYLLSCYWSMPFRPSRRMINKACVRTRVCDHPCISKEPVTAINTEPPSSQLPQGSRSFRTVFAFMLFHVPTHLENGAKKAIYLIDSCFYYFVVCF